MFGTSGVNRVGHTPGGPGSQGQDEGKAPPYGIYGYPTHQGGHGSGYNQQDYATAAAGMYPVDPAMAWHAAAYNNLYRYEAASLAADWTGNTHHNPQMGFVSEHNSDPNSLICPGSQPNVQGGGQTSTRGTPSPPQPLSEFKPNLAFSSGNRGPKRDEEGANQSSAVNGGQNNFSGDFLKLV